MAEPKKSYLDKGLRSKASTKRRNLIHDKLFDFHENTDVYSPTGRRRLLGRGTRTEEDLDIMRTSLTISQENRGKSNGNRSYLYGSSDDEEEEKEEVASPQSETSIISSAIKRVKERREKRNMMKSPNRRKLSPTPENRVTPPKSPKKSILPKDQSPSSRNRARSPPRLSATPLNRATPPKSPKRSMPPKDQSPSSQNVARSPPRRVVAESLRSKRNLMSGISSRGLFATKSDDNLNMMVIRRSLAMTEEAPKSLFTRGLGALEKLYEDLA